MPDNSLSASNQSTPMPRGYTGSSAKATILRSVDGHIPYDDSMGDVDQEDMRNAHDLG